MRLVIRTFVSGASGERSTRIFLGWLKTLVSHTIKGDLVPSLVCDSVDMGDVAGRFIARLPPCAAAGGGATR
jgi:hypothetical protein